MAIEDRLQELGATLPDELKLPPGVEVPFQWVRVHNDRAFISGHGALNQDGTPAGPFGRVPSEVSLQEAQESARLAALATLGSLRTTLGDLDRIEAWLTVDGLVNADPGFAQTTAVLNPYSELLLDVFGAEVANHARTAIGVTALPLNLPVVASAKIAIRS